MEVNKYIEDKTKLIEMYQRIMECIETDGLIHAAYLIGKLMAVEEVKLAELKELGERDLDNLKITEETLKKMFRDRNAESTQT